MRCRAAPGGRSWLPVQFGLQRGDEVADLGRGEDVVAPAGDHGDGAGAAGDEEPGGAGDGCPGHGHAAASSAAIRARPTCSVYAGGIAWASPSLVIHVMPIARRQSATVTGRASERTHDGGP